MRVMILGAGGQVGAELLHHCAAIGDQVQGFTRADVDVADGARVRELVRAHTPEVVFNAAAYTAVDRAESEPGQADLVNHVAARRIAEVCRDAQVRLVHYSTDYVFDGLAVEPIPEDAPTRPQGVYAATKLAGEEAVRRIAPYAYVVRTSWVYGVNGANFVRTVLRVTRERGEMRVVDDQRGSPTWARDLALASRELVDVGPPGTYHLTNGGDCTWFELARAVVSEAGIDAVVTPIPTSDYPTPARRPPYSVLDNRAWRDLGRPPLRPWRTAVSEAVHEIIAGEEGP